MICEIIVEIFIARWRGVPGIDCVDAMSFIGYPNSLDDFHTGISRRSCRPLVPRAQLAARQGDVQHEGD